MKINYFWLIKEYNHYKVNMNDTYYEFAIKDLPIDTHIHCISFTPHYSPHVEYFDGENHSVKNIDTLDEFKELIKWINKNKKKNIQLKQPLKPKGEA